MSDGTTSIIIGKSIEKHLLKNDDFKLKFDGNISIFESDMDYVMKKDENGNVYMEKYNKVIKKITGISCLLS